MNFTPLVPVLQTRNLDVIFSFNLQFTDHTDLLWSKTLKTLGFIMLNTRDIFTAKY